MKKILVIEDDPVLSGIYCSKCRTEGFDAEVVRDGKIAIERLKENPPDLVLLDLMLPEVDGVQVIRFIRGHAGIESLPVLVLTNAYVASMVQAAWKAGANKCLTKSSCTPTRMIDEIHGLLNAMQPAAPLAAEKKAEPIRHDTHALLDKAAEFQAAIKEQFLRQAPKMMTEMRAAFQKASDSAGAEQTARLLELFRCVHALGGSAAVARFAHLAQMCSALEALVKELHDKTNKVNVSSLRTVAQALDFLGVLFEKETPGSDSNSTPLILVVDDDTISRETVCSALEKANLRAISVDDPLAALKLLEQNPFDLIFTDVEMPGLNGFDLCKKVHALELNRNTPVVFVTSLRDFDTRARSALSGGVDLIGKPFLLIELAVKALPYILRKQIQTQQTVSQLSARAA